MGNGALAIGPKLPRPSSTLPSARSARMHAGWLQLALSISGVILIRMKMTVGINSLVPLAGIEHAWIYLISLHNF